MITPDLARALQSAGVLWSPIAGDRFAVNTPGMEHDVFYLADMTVDVQRFVGGSVIGFNGVSEWALDSVDLEETIWLPREDQLRAVLGEVFLRLERDSDGQYAVHLSAVPAARPGAVSICEPHQDAECAYAHAVLAVLAR